MKSDKILVAAWMAIAVYGFSSVAIGSTGLLAYGKLYAEKVRLAENMENLRLINDELEGSLTALRSDSDTIAVYARELGYARKDESLVRISGLPAASRRVAAAGNLLAVKKPVAVDDTTLRIASLSAGALALLFIILAGRNGKRPRGFHGI
ncbi:MAG: hypothetical protein A2413_20935 [Treponema sp. RIFOXYC1_FULL_61_9]|nr:MAG: hypothetical protein A2001_17485 [Treponema sp. GWC1_61_84]OHE69709.1 MAG: hypothetical protein A2413_20935 [Treponema sp. RIFOXYC1_FULL_61_9]